jgi:DNA-binding CsgD family transcriptional regulator
MAALFGPTQTERRVLSSVAGGYSVADIAQALGVGEATIRTHLVRLFDKTGVHRQAELVALFHSFTCPVRPA